MEATQTLQAEDINGFYNRAANLMLNEKRSDEEVIDDLVSQGLDNESASTVVFNLQAELARVRKDRASKDMLYGVLWCVGGIVATVTDIGFIFWGAIVFGAIQFIKGVINSVK